MSANAEKGKRIARNTLMMYIRMFITMGLSLYTSRIVLNALGVEDFGIYNLVGGMVALFSFANAAMMAATQRFINFELGRGDSAALSEVFKSAYVIHIIIAVLIVIVGCSLGKYFIDIKLQIPAASRPAALIVLYFSIATCALQILTLPYSSDIVAHERISTYAWISIFESASRLCVAFMIKMSDDNRLILYAALLAVLQFISYCINIFYCRRHFQEARGGLMLCKKRLKEMGQFAVWCLIGCTAGAFAGQGLNVLLGMFFNPVVNAARGISVQVQSAISTFGSNINTAMTPQITQSYASGDYDFFFNILYRGSKYVFFMMALIAIPIMLRADYILELWLGEVPAYTVDFLKWIICATMIESISFPLMRASDASGKIKIYHSVVGGILLLILPVSYVVLKLTHNPVSVFVVYFCINFVAWFARLIILKRTVNLSIQRYLRDVMSRVLVIFVASLLICDYLQQQIPDNFAGLTLTVIITTLVTGSLAYILGLDKSEKNFILAKIHILLHKNK